MRPSTSTGDHRASRRSVPQLIGGQFCTGNEADDEYADPELLAELAAMMSDSDSDHAEGVDDDDDGEVEDDDNDESLLQELQQLQGDVKDPSLADEPVEIGKKNEIMVDDKAIDVVQRRLDQYHSALRSQTGTTVSDQNRVKRYRRAISTLEECLSDLKRGKSVNLNVLPPEPLGSGDKDAQPNRQVQIPIAPLPDTDVRLTSAKELRNQFRQIALDCRSKGDKVGAASALQSVKAMDNILARLVAGIHVDPAEYPAIASMTVPHLTLQELLVQGREKFIANASIAASAQDGPKARRLNRVAGQYQEAIATLTKYKHNNNATNLGDQLRSEVSRLPPFSPDVDLAQALQAELPQLKVQQFAKPTSATVPSPSAGHSLPKQSNNAETKSRHSNSANNLKLLSDRHRLFREAALQAKRGGQLEDARQHLRAAKGIETLIESAKSGLRIDLQSVPIPPQLKRKDVELSQVIGHSNQAESHSSVTANEQLTAALFGRLEKELIDQIGRAVQRILHYRKTSESANANRFETVVERSKVDLAKVRTLFKSSPMSPLSFRYDEMQVRHLVCCADLSPAQMEITVKCGLHFQASVMTDLVGFYCKLDYPYPRDMPTKVKSDLIKMNVNEADKMVLLNFSTSIVINRSDKALLRIIRRHPLRIELIGASRRSRLLLGIMSPAEEELGVAFAPIKQLEQHCKSDALHQLMTANGRKQCTAMPGAQLEVLVRVRTALGGHPETANVTERILTLN